MEKVKQHRLYAIGDELVERYVDKSLDFSTFQRLFREAVEICGPDDPGLEMFSPVIKDFSWRDWMLAELRETRIKRVA